MSTPQEPLVPEAILIAAGRLDAQLDDRLDEFLAAVRPLIESTVDEREWGTVVRRHMTIAPLTDYAKTSLITAALIRIYRWERMPS